MRFRIVALARSDCGCTAIPLGSSCNLHSWPTGCTHGESLGQELWGRPGHGCRPSSHERPCGKRAGMGRLLAGRGQAQPICEILLSSKLIVDTGCALCRRPSAVATRGTPERCVPGTHPASTARTHHCWFDSPFRSSTVLPTYQRCCFDGSLKLLTKRSSRLGSGRWECFTDLNSQCRYAREPPVGIEPTTIRLRSACSTS